MALVRGVACNCSCAGETWDHACVVPAPAFTWLHAEPSTFAVATNPELGKIAYFCRFAAADIGVKELAVLNGAEEAAANDFLVQILNKLESDRVSYHIEKASEDSDIALVTTYALTVFKRADDIDRAGAADKDTARAFAAAANFMDVARQLGPPEAQLDKMSKYAKARAATILSAVNEGRVVEPPPGADDGTFGFGGMLPAPLSWACLHNSLRVFWFCRTTSSFRDILYQPPFRRRGCTHALQASTYLRCLGPLPPLSPAHQPLAARISLSRLQVATMRHLHSLSSSSTLSLVHTATHPHPHHSTLHPATVTHPPQQACPTAARTPV